jgi:hypothetical protein
MPLSYDSNFGSHQMASIQRGLLGTHFTIASQDPSVQVTGHGWATHWMQWGFSGQLKSFGPHNMLLEAFKVGHELRVHARDIAKAILLTMLVVAAVTPALFIFLMHVYGFEANFEGSLSTWADFMQWSERASSYGLASTSSTLAEMDRPDFYGRYEAFFDLVCGVVIVGILFYLRREFPRFPFSPIGVVIAAEVSGQFVPFGANIVWLSFLMIWIIKALIFRWLGVRSFREKIVPGVIMVLCGMIFGMMAYLFRQVGLLKGCMK